MWAINYSQFLAWSCSLRKDRSSTITRCLYPDSVVAFLRSTRAGPMSDSQLLCSRHFCLFLFCLGIFFLALSLFLSIYLSISISYTHTSLRFSLSLSLSLFVSICLSLISFFFIFLFFQKKKNYVIYSIFFLPKIYISRFESIRIYSVID